MCLKKSALKWHISLFAIVKKKMNVDFRIWKNELLREYWFDCFVFRKKIENFVFRFDDSLTFNQYFSRKTNLLHDAEITKKNMMIQYLWNELEFQLQTTISRKKNNDFLKNFEKRVRQNETVARRVHEFNKQNRYRNRYEKSFSRNEKSKSLSVERIDKFLKKLIKNKKKIALFEFESKKLRLQFLKIFRRSYQRNDRLFFDHVDDAMIFTETMIVRKKNSEKKQKKLFEIRSKKKIKMTKQCWMTKTKKLTKHFKKWFIASILISIRVRKTSSKFVVFRWRIFRIVS